MRTFNLLRVAMAALLMPLLALAQETGLPMESDWMELVKGHRDARTGTELRAIDADGDDAKYQKITLAIPKKTIGNPDAIEEVLVVGRKPEKPEPILDMSYEWLDDYDEDNYGLVIRLSKDTKWPIRLYMRSDEGYIDR
jgi:hypothetical protein